MPCPEFPHCLRNDLTAPCTSITHQLVIGSLHLGWCPPLFSAFGPPSFVFLVMWWTPEFCNCRPGMLQHSCGKVNPCRKRPTFHHWEVIFTPHPCCSKCGKVNFYYFSFQQNLKCSGCRPEEGFIIGDLDVFRGHSKGQGHFSWPRGLPHDNRVNNLEESINSMYAPRPNLCNLHPRTRMLNSTGPWFSSQAGRRESFTSKICEKMWIKPN